MKGNGSGVHDGGFYTVCTLYRPRGPRNCLPLAISIHAGRRDFVPDVRIDCFSSYQPWYSPPEIMCQFIQYRKNGEEYVCVRLDENGLEEEATRGTADDRVQYLHGLGPGIRIPGNF